MLANVFAILAATPGNLTRELRDFPARELKRRPVPGKWSVQEILAHLAGVEEYGMGSRVEAIVTSNCTTIALTRANPCPCWLTKMGNTRKFYTFGS